MTVADDIRDETLRHKLGLARWEQGLVRQIISLLNETDSDLERRISLAVERHASDNVIRRLQRIREELRAVNAEAYAAVRDRLRAELQEAASRTAERYAGILASAVPFDWELSRPSPNLLRAIVTSHPFQGALLKDHVTKLAGNRLDALTREIQVGLAQSESLSQLLQRVRGTRKGRFRDGVLQRIGRHQAEAITRTAAQHVTEEARESLFRDNADIVTGRMWVATLDHRTCPICQPRDGLVWRYSERTGVYRADGHDQEWGAGPGRAHFRCRCTSIPVLGSPDELEAAGIDVKKLGTGQRAALDNPVSVSTDYPEWLRTQSKEIQDSALGPRRAELFRKGESLEEVWSKRFIVQFSVPAGLDEVLPRGQ